MSYRSLLVHLDVDAHCNARVDLAIGLARRLDSHLVGLAPTGIVALPSVPEGAGAVGELTALAWELMHEQAQQAAREFRQACLAAGMRSHEVLVDVADKAESLIRHAHCSDLTVLGQADQDGPWNRAAQGVVEDVVLHSARPTLLLPYSGAWESIGTQVLVAWDDSREAARAVADALPLLRLAGLVRVISWKEPAPAGISAIADMRRPRLHALQQWLRWHGVNAEVHEAGTEIPVHEAMLSQAADLGADLIVMGAYGHSRWRERVLGGATRGLLQSMTAPVLMSH